MEYRSRRTFLGLPLIHVAMSRVENGVVRRGVARGWIAVGDVALGVLVGVGGMGMGAFALGGVALGGFAFGGMSLAVIALGGMALGVLALGGGAVGWHAALGGLAVAREYAVGGLAIARHANDAAARHYFEQDLPAALLALTEHSEWVWVPLVIAALFFLRGREEPPGRR